MFKYNILTICLCLTACSGKGDYLDDDFGFSDSGQSPIDVRFSGKVNGNFVDISPIIGASLSDKIIAKPSASSQDLINRAINATNELRAEKNLPALKVDDTLTAYATLRAQEIYSTFSHYRLDETHALFRSYFKGSGLSGENLANGKSSPEEIVKKSLRGSSTHYANIIHNGFSHIGIGVYFDQLTQRYYWAQIFASPNVDSVYQLGDVGGLSASRVQRALYDNSTHRHQRLKITAPEKSPAPYQNHLSTLYGNTAYIVELENNRQIVMKKNNNWQNQTIGEVLENQKTLTYLNLGSAYSPKPEADFTAIYKGEVIGDLAQRDRIKATLNATVHFTGTDKYMILNITDAQLNGSPNTKYNITHERLNWDANNAQFIKDEKNFARLYGLNAEEIGGQFNRQVDHEIYRGVYGGARP